MPDFLPGDDGFFFILKNYVVGKGTEFHMQNAFYNIPFYVRCGICCLTALFYLPCFAQKGAQGDNLNEQQRKLIIEPQKYLLSPQTDIIIGSARVRRGDRNGYAYSITTKGVYQAGNYWHLNIGAGYTRLNSHQISDPDSLPIQEHFADIVHIPLGMSFIIGDDRGLVITTAELLPCYIAGSSENIHGLNRFSWGTSFESGFLLRFNKYWYAGLTAKLQLFRFGTSATDLNWPRYGFAGVGVAVRCSY